MSLKTRIALFFFAATQASAATQSKRILLSGFEPFGGRFENSSQVAVETFVAEHHALPDPAIAAEVESIIVPVAYDIAPQELLRKMDSYQPDIVISFGESGEEELSLEQRARNLDDSPFPDNRGIVRQGMKIVDNAPEFLKTLLPVNDFRNDLEQAGISAKLSKSAGSYLCNHIFYHLMYSVSKESAFQGIKAGFIHVPAQDIQENPQYPQQYAQAIRIMLRRLASAP
jgi:Pyrrolidone-carboxylate peptidase (N-terminal pyroglutamyl peptidase)